MQKKRKNKTPPISLFFCIDKISWNQFLNCLAITVLRALWLEAALYRMYNIISRKSLDLKVREYISVETEDRFQVVLLR